jgi:hypothetical protein
MSVVTISALLVTAFTTHIIFFLFQCLACGLTKMKKTKIYKLIISKNERQNSSVFTLCLCKFINCHKSLWREFVLKDKIQQVWSWQYWKHLRGNDRLLLSQLQWCLLFLITDVSLFRWTCELPSYIRDNEHSYGMRILSLFG